jgi:hypothetical protein
MSTKRMVVDLPADVYERFKIECVKNHSSIKDGVLKCMCASLDGMVTKLEQKELSSTKIKDGFIFGQEDSSVLVRGHKEGTEDPPFLKTEQKKAEDFGGLFVKKDEFSTIRQDIADFPKMVGLLGSELRSFIDAYSKDKSDIDKKFLALAKTLGPIIQILKNNTGATVCADDVKALALLSGESTDRWYQKDQFDELLGLLQLKKG